MTPRLHHEDVVLVIGKRRSGKSFRAKQLLADEMAAGARVVVFDPHDEYSRKGRKTKATNLGPLRARCTLDELLERPELLDAPKLSLAVVPDPDSIAADCLTFLRLVRATGDVTICLDEVGEYSHEAGEGLSSAATQSRHWGAEGCPLILVAQRAVLVPKSARGQASIVFSGIQSDPEDLQALAKVTGSQEFAARVSRLPKPGLLEWRDNAVTTTTTQEQHHHG